MLANKMYNDIIAPMLERNRHVHGYVTATGRAAPLMTRTDISPFNLVKEFYSDASFAVKVANYLNECTP
jgi:hypothetical protein